MDDDDDWLHSSNADQGSSQDPLVEQEYQRLASRYTDAGYREGITDGKLSTLQEGFDQSFAASVSLSRRVGRLRGAANALLAYCNRLTSNPKPNGGADGVSSASIVDNELVSEVRELIQDSGRLRRVDVLPRDLEREEHERLDHAESRDEAFALDITPSREMEGLEEAMNGLASRNSASQANESTPLKQDGAEEVLSRLEARLQSLMQRLLSPAP